MSLMLCCICVLKSLEDKKLVACGATLLPTLSVLQIYIFNSVTFLLGKTIKCLV